MSAKKKTKAKAKPAVVEKPADKPELRPEDLARAFRETYSAAPPPAPSSVTVTLDPDVAPHFQSARAVNEALRALLRIVKQVRSS